MKAFIVTLIVALVFSIIVYGQETLADTTIMGVRITATKSGEGPQYVAENTVTDSMLVKIIGTHGSVERHPGDIYAVSDDDHPIFYHLLGHKEKKLLNNSFCAHTVGVEICSQPEDTCSALIPVYNRHAGEIQRIRD